MINKKLYRNYFLLTKYLPFCVAVIYYICSIISCFEVNTLYLILLFKCPLWCTIYGIVTSKVYKLCVLHRIPLYYMVLCNLIYIVKVDVYYNQILYLILYTISFIAFLFTMYIVKLKLRKDKLCPKH